jgi:hypothetical protein
MVRIVPLHPCFPSHTGVGVEANIQAGEMISSPFFFLLDRTARTEKVKQQS